MTTVNPKKLYCVEPNIWPNFHFVNFEVLIQKVEGISGTLQYLKCFLTYDIINPFFNHYFKYLLILSKKLNVFI